MYCLLSHSDLVHVITNTIDNIEPNIKEVYIKNEKQKSNC